MNVNRIFVRRALRFTVVGWAIGLLCVPVTAQPAASTAAADLGAYRAGQSYVRAFEDYLQPGICGIVVERERCREDFRALRRLRGPDEMDQPVDQWLTDGDLDHRLQHWNGMRVPDATWQEQPAFGWWYTAGALSVAGGLPDNEGGRDFVGSILELLAKHADAAPTEYRALIDAGNAPFQRSKRLRDALAASIPQPAFPSVPTTDDPIGYARLGVLYSTLQQLIDNQLALSRPESRAFGFALLDRMDVINQMWGGSFSSTGLRKALSGDIPLDREWVDRELRQPLTPFAANFRSHPSERAAFFAGVFVAQTAYNAAILKDPQFGGSNTASQFASESSLPKSLVTSIIEVGSAPKNSWPAVNAAATRAVLAILNQ
jgi:hypothetical protein